MILIMTIYPIPNLYQQSSPHLLNTNKSYLKQIKFINKIQIQICSDPIKQAMTTTENRKIISLETDKLSESLKSRNWGDNQLNDPSIQPTVNQTRQQHKDGTFNFHQIIDGTQTHQIQTTTHQIYSEPSFKKNKAKESQFSKLLELKQQYEILKNMNMQESLIYTHKTNKDASISESGKSDAYSSKRSSKQFHLDEKNRNANLLEYEKKQLEIMLSNSMNKVEELLKNEIEYKRKIHELSNRGIERDQIDELLRVHKKEQKELLETIETLKREDERLRDLNKKFSQKIGNLESQIAGKDVELRRIIDEKRKVDEQVYIAKQKLMTSEIQIKKEKMEYEILEKDKNSEISYLKRLLEDANSRHLSGDQTLVQQLRQEIQLKDQRYELLLEQLQSLKRAPAPRQSEDKTEKLFEELIMKLQDKQRTTQPESSVVRELRIIKQQLSTSKDDRNLEQKIYALQKIIEEQNIEKSKFMEQLKGMSEDYDRLYKQNSDLKSKLVTSEAEFKKLKKDLYQSKQQLEQSQQAKLSFSLSQDQNQQFISKTIEKLEQQNRELRLQLNDLKHSAKAREDQLEDQLRSLRRELDEANFKIDKLTKQNEFNLQLARSKATSEVDILNKQIQRIAKQRDEWKRQFDNMKAFYENKLAEMRGNIQKFNSEWNMKLTAKQQEVRQLRVDGDNNMNALRNRYESQQSALINRLESLVSSNEGLAKDNAKLIHMESEIYQLRQQTRRMFQLNTNIDHLWTIKQAQYQNVHAILQDMQ